MFCKERLFIMIYLQFYLSFVEGCELVVLMAFICIKSLVLGLQLYCNRRCAIR